MSQNDRTTGLVGNSAFKVPCRAATTANIALTGEQTLDGVACVTDDRVLVKDQTDPIENGIWVVDTGSWERADDADGSYDFVNGSLVRVNEGTTHAGGIFALGADEPIVVGETELAFSRLAINFVAESTTVAAAGQTLVNLGVTYQVGSNNLAVYVNGLRQRITADYNETSSSSITFTYALQAGDEIDAYAGLAIGNLVAALAAAVSIADAGDYYLAVTVEAALQEIAQGITADVGNASAVFTNGSTDRILRWNTPLTANRTLTLSAANAKEGAMATAVRGPGATGNFTLDVGGLATLRAPGEWARCRYDAGSAAWILEAYGILPSAEALGLTADNGDASVNLTTGTSLRVQRWATALTADRTASLQTTAAWTGARFRVIRAEGATGAFALVVAGAATLLRLAPGQWGDFVYNGTAWVVEAVGDQRPGSTALNVLGDDYTGEEIDGFRWQSLIGTDAACRQATVRTDQAGGVARLTTGAGAGATMAVNGVQLHSQLNWRADKGCFVWEGRVALDAITAVALFVGLTDQRALLEMPFTLAAGDALTSNATDAVGVLFDTAADTDNWWLVGVKADVDAAKQNTAIAPVVDTFETWRIELTATGSASFYRNGTLIGVAMLNAVTPSALLTPVIAGFARGAASRNIDVDEQLVAQLR